MKLKEEQLKLIGVDEVVSFQGVFVSLKTANHYFLLSIMFFFLMLLQHILTNELIRNSVYFMTVGHGTRPSELLSVIKHSLFNAKGNGNRHIYLLSVMNICYPVRRKVAYSLVGLYAKDLTSPYKCILMLI